MKQNFGYELLDTIESNDYLQHLYKQLITQYTRHIFNQPQKHLTDKEKNDLLLFSDLLSKSNHPTKKGKQKVWGQEIVSLLNTLYPEDLRIQSYMVSVLNSCNNYMGANHAKLQDIKPYNFLDEVINEAKKSSLKIPNTDDKFFFAEQKEIYNQFRMKYFSFSAPTSMGKSFLMRVFIRQQIEELNTNLNYAIIVPTKALINEVRTKLIEELDVLLTQKDYRVVTSSGDILLEQKHNFIFVMTPERLLYLLNTKDDVEINYVFVDEAHKISSKDTRSSFYYELINKLSRQRVKPNILFSSPNIPNPGLYLDLLPKEILKDFKRATFSPVSQLKYFVDTDKNELKFYNDSLREPLYIGDLEPKTDLISLLKKIGPGKKNIVYFSSIAKTIEASLEYANTIEDKTDQKLLELAKDIKAEIHDDYYMASLIKKGIAYHVGYLPANIRLRIEDAFREGPIDTIFCTSTLIEGVNLPADNLIVTSYKVGRSNLDNISFKNLIGRVGRIIHNLFGNVFFIKLTQNEKMDTYEKLLKNEVKDERLSLDNILTKKQKLEIVDSISQGDMTLSKVSDKKETNYDFMRQISMILIDNIIDGSTNSLVTRNMVSSDQQDHINLIRDKYSNYQRGSGINITYDQTKNLKLAIEKGLNYPQKDINDYFPYQDTLKFLEDLARIFKWNLYENTDIGKTNKETGEFSSLKYYATLLIQWMSSNGIKKIIESRIEFLSEHPENFTYKGYGEREYINFDVNSMEHKNKAISNVLSDLDKAILYKIANYFREFSLEFKKFHNIESIENDWYEYVEYGSTNIYTITLQRFGYSRESATKIKSRKSHYIIEKPNNLANFSLNFENLTNSSDVSLRMETENIFRNVPEIFL